jgi:carbon-monoxide dehydrogenase medium subunit
VKPAPFDYVAPTSVEEAVAVLRQHGDEAKVLAGGQSLVPMLNFRLARPAVLVDVNRVPGLDGLSERDGVLHAGALVRQRRLERWAAGRAPLLATALRHVGHLAIRVRGTVAGSIAHADPAAELPALLVCHDGAVVVRSAGGERVVPAADLFLGPLVTALAADELVVETRWPLPAAGAGWGFHEVARRHGDFALAGAAAIVALRDGHVHRARLALFGCGPTPVRAVAAEKALTGQVPTAAAIDAAARLAAEGLDAQDDLHATAAYRRRVAATLLARAVGDAVGQAPGAAG